MFNRKRSKSRAPRLSLREWRALTGRTPSALQLDFYEEHGFLLPPIAGATTPTNVDWVDPGRGFPRSLPVTTDQSINQGDMVWWDAVNGTLKPVVNANSVAVGATGGFCGTSKGTTPINIYGVENLAALEITHTGAVLLFTTAGEFYPNFQAVTVGADAQTITLVGVTAANRVGWVCTDPPLTPNPAAGSTPLGETLAGAVGVRARVWLEPKFPATTH